MNLTGGWTNNIREYMPWKQNGGCPYNAIYNVIVHPVVSNAM